MTPHLFYVLVLKVDDRTWIVSVHTEHDEAQRVRGALQQQADRFFAELAKDARGNFNIGRTQHWLTERGYVLEVDGTWGPATMTALCAELDKHSMLDHTLRDPAVLRLIISSPPSLCALYGVVGAYDDPSAVWK